MPDSLQVKMLGSFSIQYAARAVDDQGDRMHKVWLLLAYLIYNRDRRVTQEQYLSLLQGTGSDESADPGGKLKTMLYRVRSTLNQLNDTAGHDWILRRNGTYAWNTEVPLTLDVEEFEKLCKAAAASPQEEERLSLYRQALALYRGDFLSKLSMEPWVMSISSYYHQMYLDGVAQTLPLLEARELWPEAVELCEKALRIEPYSEELYQHLMRCRAAAGDRAGALRAYEEMSDLLLSTFGVMPSEESRALYRDASRQDEGLTIPVGTVTDRLREPSKPTGAMYCEYDFFKMLYQLQARVLVRSGDVIHIALFSLRGRNGKELARRSLDLAMDNLQELLLANLRQGDVITRCSVSQFIAMFPQANYEDSRAVCQRILRVFGRKYPHSPAEILFSVQPLEPILPAGQGGQEET